jgi:hypothetical protein
MYFDIQSFSYLMYYPHIDYTRSNTRPSVRAYDRKVKLSLRLINEAPLHEDTQGTEVIAATFLNSAIDGGQRSPSRPSCFTPGKSPPVSII